MSGAQESHCRPLERVITARFGVGQVNTAHAGRNAWTAFQGKKKSPLSRIVLLRGAISYCRAIDGALWLLGHIEVGSFGGLICDAASLVV